MFWNVSQRRSVVTDVSFRLQRWSDSEISLNHPVMKGSCVFLKLRYLTAELHNSDGLIYSASIAWNHTIVNLYLSAPYDKIWKYTGCNRRNGPDFGRVYLMLNYNEKPQNTNIQSWTVWEIMASEVWNFDSCYTLTDYQIRIETGRNMWFL